MDTLTWLAETEYGLRHADAHIRLGAAWAVLDAAGAAALTLTSGPAALAAHAAYDESLEARDLLPPPTDDKDAPQSWQAQDIVALARLLNGTATVLGNLALDNSAPDTVYRCSQASLLARAAGEAMAKAGAASQ